MTGNAAWLRMKLVGRTIVGVRLRPFTDGRGGKATNPELVLDDGTTIDFDTQETETDYGIAIRVWPPAVPAVLSRRGKSRPPAR